MSVRVGPLILTALSLLVPAVGQGQELPFPPVQAQICREASDGRKIVDKKEIAKYLLRKSSFNAAAIPERSSFPHPGLDIPRRILADREICTGNASCSDSDKKSLRDIRGNMILILSGSITGYEPSREIAPEAYFLGANDENAVICQQVEGRPVEAPGAVFTPPGKTTSAFRIRGKVDDLYVDRSQTKDFQATSQAVVSLGEDGSTKRRTETLQAVVAYRIDTDLLKENGQRLELLPYIQASRSVVKPGPGSTAKPSANKIFDVGMMASAFIVVPNQLDPFGHVLNLRPDLLADDYDNSRILSLNMQYVPVRNSLLNDFIRFDRARDELFSFKPMLDIRLNSGHYLDKGDGPNAEEKRNFIRAGAQVGIAVVSDMESLPLSLTSTYTHLHSFSGHKNIGYFSNNLTFSLDPKKYFGLSANYTNGTREDTARREQLWTIGLSVRF